MLNKEEEEIAKNMFGISRTGMPFCFYNMTAQERENIIKKNRHGLRSIALTKIQNVVNIIIKWMYRC